MRKRNVQQVSMKVLILMIVCLFHVPLSLVAQDFSISKTDKVCTNAEGSVTVNISNLTGDPQSVALRRKGEPNTLINVGQGSTTYTLYDDVPTDTDGDRVYRKTWGGVPVGEYEIYYINNSTSSKSLVGSVTVAENIITNYESPTLHLAAFKSYVLLNDHKNAAVYATAKKGIGPFRFTAEIKDQQGQIIDTRTWEGATPNDRIWRITRLPAGAEVKVYVSDLATNLCEGITSGTHAIITLNSYVEGTNPNQISPLLHMPYNNIYRRVNNTTDVACNIDNYLYFSFSNRGTDAMDDYLHALENGAVRVFLQDPGVPGSRTEVTGLTIDRSLLEISPVETDVTESSSFFHAFIKIPEEAMIEGKEAIIQLQDLTTGNYQEEANIIIDKFGVNSNEPTRQYDETRRPSFKFTPIATATRQADCNTTEIYQLRYRVFAEDTQNGDSDQDFKGGATQYFFPQNTVFKIEKKQADGSWLELSDIPGESRSLFISPLTNGVSALNNNREQEKNIDLSQHKHGTYRVSLQSDCPWLNVAKEIIVPEARPGALVKATAESGTCNFGIHGNTGGARINLTTDVSQFNMRIERQDGQTSITQPITAAFSDKFYNYTFTFPVIIENVKPVTDDKGKHINIGDLPAGKYNVFFETCGELNKVEFEVTNNTLRQWEPKNTEGYKDGLKIVPGCSSAEFYFEYNSFACFRSQLNWISMRGDLTYTSGGRTRTSSTRSSLGDGDFSNMVGRPGNRIVYNQVGKVNLSVYFNIPGLYSAISKQVVETDPLKATFSARNLGSYTITEGAPKVFRYGANICDPRNPNSGNVSIGIIDGIAPVYPIRHELHRVANEQERVDITASPMKLYTANQGDPSGTVFADLESGWYLTRSWNNYGSGCAAAEQYIEVRSVDIPNIQATYSKECYVNGLRPNNIRLNVAPEMYDVYWYEIKDDVATKLNTAPATSINVAYDGPGNHIYEARTFYAKGTSCEGTPGATRRLLVQVQDCTPPIKRNLWVGTISTDFNTPGNWSKGYVPTSGEDIEFATVSNNEGQPAIKDCIVPEGFYRTAGSLINETDKAFIISPNSYIEVTSNIVGYDTPEAATRLVIKGDNSGSKPNASFAVHNDNPCATVVYATVEIPVLGTAETAIGVKDTNPHSPTFGQQLTSDKQKWQLFGIPVQSMTRITDGLSVTSPFYMQYYDEPYNHSSRFYRKWRNVNATMPITAFKGYQMTANEKKMAVVKGRLNLCNTTLTLTREAALVNGANGTDAQKRFALGENNFANSYTSAINVADINFPQEVEPTVYLYHTGSFTDWYKVQDNNSSTAAGAFLAIPKNAASLINNGKIPSMQGFMLKFTPEETKYSTTRATVYIPYQANSTTRNIQPLRSKRATNAQEDKTGVLQVDIQGLNGNDRLYLIEKSGTTEGYDRGWDGTKHEMLTAAPQLYVETTDGRMQVNTNSDVTTQPISITANAGANLRLTVAAKKMFNTENLALIDRVARKSMAITNAGVTYDFTANGNESDKGRFWIVDANNFDWSRYENTVTSIKNTIMVKSAQPINVTVYNLSGSMVSQFTTIADKLESFKLNTGVYIIRLQNNDMIDTHKIVVP